MSKVLKVKRHIDALLRFNGLHLDSSTPEEPTSDNIEEIYSNNMESYFFASSDTKTSKGIEFSKELNRNVYIEPEYSKTKDGFALTEKDFLKMELELMKCYVVGDADAGPTKQFKYYMNYLTKKLNEPIQPKQNEPKVTAGKIIRKYHEEIEACKYGEQKPLLIELGEPHGYNYNAMKQALDRHRKSYK